MVEFRPLQADDDRDSFCCGDPDLDRYFRKYAGQNQFRLYVGSTYVAVEESRVLGFATVAATSIAIESLPKGRRQRLPHYPLPALRLARLAVDQAAQGRGIGQQLLKLVCQLALDMADRYGCVGILVDAKENAVEFYRQYGFEPVRVEVGRMQTRPSAQPMFLPIGAIARN